MSYGQYLMIRNIGIAPVEGFTVLGVSTTRNSGNSDAIGQFGTGNKQAIALLLRNELQPVVFCGNLRLSFSVKEIIVEDSVTGEQRFGRVQVQYSGKDATNRTVNRTEELGFSIEMGVHDWSDLSMAMRELVSNALDRSILHTNTWDEAEISVVNGNQVRAKSGYTSVFIPMTPEVTRFYNQLSRRFLHFNESHLLKTSVLPKRDRNLSKPTLGEVPTQRAMIYKKGVHVREIHNAEAALYDYNFGEELQLDESRTVSDSHCADSAAKVLRFASPALLATVFQTLASGRRVWESNFARYELGTEYYHNWTDSEFAIYRQNWLQAWQMSFGQKAILCNCVPEIKSLVEKKGYTPVSFPEAQGWYDAAKEWGIPTEWDVLTFDEREGQVISEPTPAAQDAFRLVWGIMRNHALLNGKEEPPLHCFVSIMESSAQTHGFVRDNEIYIHRDIATEGVNDMLVKVMLEEVVHYVTGARDHSRDLQDYLFRMLTYIFMQKLRESPLFPEV